MSWVIQDTAPAGYFLLATLSGGVFIDPFGTIKENDLLERVQSYASGWTPTHVEWKHGIFGFGETIRVYGKATSDLPVSIARNQVISAFNSFTAIAAADATVLVSDSLSITPPTGSDEWASTLQLIAIAVIVVGVVWGIKQFKEISQ